MPSIWNAIKIPFVVKNIKYISTVDFKHVVISLNKFLNDDFKISCSEDDNVKSLLESFDDYAKRMFFNRETCELRQALVRKESYFDLALMNFLLCHDEKTELDGNILAKKVAESEFCITEFGITYYKIFAAMSKKCTGKKSLYRFHCVNEWGNPVGKSHYIRYDVDCDYVFEKLKEQKFKKTSNP